MFDAMYCSAAVLDATSDRSWVRAMLDTEAALCRAAGRVGLIPEAAATAIARQCGEDFLDPTELARAAAASATPVVELVERLRAALPDELARHVHPGATSQDIVDTALMLVVRRSLPPIQDDLEACSGRLAELALAHRDTGQVGRTLLQWAEPITFGSACQAWRGGVDEARAGLDRQRLSVQLGGAVGTRSAFAGHGAAMTALMAAELGLADADPWHTDRTRVAELAAALGIAAGSLAKIAQDVILLSQHEIAEVSEGEAGRSSAMPHKRNPARSVLVIACAHRVPALVATILAGMPQELQRAAGRWQAEWPTMTELLRLVGGAAMHTRTLLDQLRIDPRRMGEHL